MVGIIASDAALHFCVSKSYDKHFSAASIQSEKHCEIRNYIFSLFVCNVNYSMIRLIPSLV